MDVVYPLKRKMENPELRYSLRSIAANMKHDQVFYAGYKPWWARGNYIRNSQHGTKYQNSLGNIIAACKEAGVSDDFILMNDDFYILRPALDVPCYHKGPIAAFLANRPQENSYSAIIRSTLELLRAEGIAEPLFYGHHTPTVLNKHRVLEIVERFKGKHFMLRSVYHNLYGPEGTHRPDVKKNAATDKITETDFLSTSDGFAKTAIFRNHMRQLFPSPCYYEKA